jgi:uncharacterized protein (TIGR02231 family)
MNLSLKATVSLLWASTLWPMAPVTAAEFTLPSETQEVTAYQGMALIKRTVNISVTAAGTHTVRIPGLPLRLNPDSLNVQGYGSSDAVLQHFQLITPPSFEKPTPDPQEAQLIQKLDALEASMDTLETREELNQVHRDFLKLFMQRLQQVPKNNDDFSVKTWEEALQFTLKNQRDLLNSQQSVTHLKGPLREDIQRFRQALGHYRQHHPHTQSAEVQLYFTKPGSVKLMLSYLISGVQWNPVYEARLTDKTLNIRYGGEIYQGSGENWNNVQLKLSTATPQLNQFAPTPMAWPVNAYNPEAQRPVPAGAMSKRTMSNVMPAPAPEADVMDEEAAPVPSQVAAISDHGIALDFGLPGSQSLQSSSVARQVTLATRTLSADTTYKVIPRQSALAFLEVNITNNTGLPLLPGKMRTYVGDSFTGVQNLDLIRTGQETRLNFGVDRNLQVKWTELERKIGKAGVLTDKNEMLVSYQAEVTNYKKESVNIRLLEPRPESQNDSVKIEWVKGEPEASEITDEKLRIWNFQAKPWEKKTVRMTYRITYPQELKLSF